MATTLKDQLTDWRTEPEPVSACWLPSQSFVYQRLDFGPTVVGEDLKSAIELHIEEDSPLPIEQVAWGYYQAEAGGPVLLYMSHRGLAFKAEDTHLTDRPTYPSLLAALQKDHESDSIQMVLSDTDLSAVHFTAGSHIPNQVTSVLLSEPIFSTQPETLSEKRAIIQNASAELKKRIPESAHSAILPTLLTISGSRVLSNETLEITTCEINADGSTTSQEATVSLSSDQFYQCDVRDKPFLEQKKKQAKQEEYLSTGFKVGLFAVAALIVLQLFLIGGNSWLKARANTVPERTLAVDRVNQKEQLLNSIELFSITAFQPFEALDRMNQLRPDSLYFENMQAGTEGKKADEQFFLQLRGIASSAAEADRFANALEKDPSFFKVSISDIRSQTRQTDFKLLVQLSGENTGGGEL
jgi:Tfp pilus assembly protein PilN